MLKTYLPPAVLEVGSDSVSAVLPSGVIHEDVLTLANSGDQELNFDLSYAGEPGTEPGWFTFSPEAGTIIPGQTADIVLLFSTYDLMPGLYQDELVIFTNDPQNPQYEVAVSLEVLPVLGLESPEAAILLVDGNPRLIWSEVDGAALYRILHSSEAYGEYNLLGETTQRFWDISTINPRGFFKVVAVAPR